MSLPKVLKLEWGTVTIVNNGEELQFNDVMLAPRLCQEWDWNKTNTHHKPGIQIADIDALVVAGAYYIILSQGMDSYLQVAPETYKYLDSNRINYEVLDSRKAVQRYNSLVSQSLKAGLLLHSTC